MRVLHVDLGKQLRGGQYQLLQLAAEFEQRGIAKSILGPLGEPFSWSALRRDFDLLHAHDARAHTCAALAAKAPLIVSRRVAFPVGRGLLSAWKYRKPAMYLAVSQYVAAQLTSAGVPAEMITVVYDGVRAMEPSTRTAGLIAPRTEDPMKGSDLVRASGLAVEFVDDLVEALKTASGMLYITRQEGLGSAALLAMSAGVPVVASRVGGLPEIVRHEETGLLVANDPAAIASAGERLLSAESSEWALRGRAMVHDGFLVRHMADATLAAYESVLKKAR